jgi:uncharacterized protein YdiU (UPF0061 family)
LANSLFPLVEDTESLEAILNDFQQTYQDQRNTMMASKLGFEQFNAGDEHLFERLETLLAMVETDMTLFYRCLATDKVDLDDLTPCFYQDQLSSEYTEQMNQWLINYNQRLGADTGSAEERLARMNSVNPKYLFRNYLAQQAIDKAEAGDYSMVNELLDVLRKPYDEQPQFEHYAAKRPEWARSKVGCSMLSCSS